MVGYREPKRVDVLCEAGRGGRRRRRMRSVVGLQPQLVVSQCLQQRERSRQALALYIPVQFRYADAVQSSTSEAQANQR